MPSPEQVIPTILTAGFSNLALEAFLANLRQYEVQVAVDVRSRPYSAYSPHFNREQIEPAVNASGLRYLYMGDELGGQPVNAGFYDEEGYVLYDRIAASPGFKHGVERLLHGLRKGLRIALCCGEENPRHCHRRLLIGRVLRENGVAVAHILSDGGLISELEILEEEARVPKQLSLFGGVEGMRPWKSIQSVLHKKAQSDFSGS